MSKNFSTSKGALHSPFDENAENGSPKTPSKKAEGKMKSNFRETKDLHSPFIDEIANPSHPGKLL